MALASGITLLLKWLKKIVLIISALVLVLALLVSIVLFFLPDVISSEKCRNLVETKISDALIRPVEVKNITWSWKDGIEINNLNIFDTPEFSDASLIFLEKVGLDIHFRDLIHRKFNFSFLISNLDINIIRDADGKLNITQFGDKKPKKEKTPVVKSSEKPKPDKPKTDKPKKKAEKPFALPVDVQSIIQISKISVTFDDRQADRLYAINNAAIGLESASIKNTPLTLSVDMDFAVDGQPIPHASLRATVKNIFKKNNELNIEGLSADLSADLPGIVAKIAGDMSTSGIDSDIRIDLTSLLTAAAPFLPDSINRSNINGTIVFSTNTTGIPDDPVTLHAELNAHDLSISGKLIKDKVLGPGNLGIALNGVIDLKNEQLLLDSADIKILENSRINAHGRIEQIKSDTRFIDMAIAPLFVDVGELTSFIKPFMPETLSIENQPGQTILSLGELKFTGTMPTGNAVVQLSNLDLCAAGIKLYADKNTPPAIEINGSRVSFENFKATLTDLFPAAAALTASINIDSLINRNKTDAIAISGIRMESLTINAGKIKKTEQSGFGIGIQGEISLDEHLTVKEIAISDQIKIDSLTQSISTQAMLNPDGSVVGSLHHLTINTPKLSLNQKPIGPVYTGCAVNLALDKLTLKKQNPLLLDITKLLTRINMEDALSLTLEMNAENTGNSGFDVAGKISADLTELTRKIPAPLLAGISAAGNARVTINASGRRPKTKEIDALKTRQLEGNLDFIETLTVGVWLDKANLKLDRAEKKTITAGPITGDPVFGYSLAGNSGKGKLNGHLLISGLTGLSDIKSPIAIELILSGDHDLLKSLDLHQQLSVEPLRIHEHIDVTIDGLDRVVTRNPMPPFPAWISDAGGKIAAGASIPDCSLISDLKLPAISDLHLGGKIDTQVELTVVPNKFISGNIATMVEEMDLAFAESITTESIFANVHLSKSYQVKSGTPTEATFPKPSTLSSNVIQTAFAGTSSANETDIYRHIRYIKKRMNPYPAVSFKAADILSGPFPLRIGASQIMLGINNGLPNLDYFQFDLLDGTINGSLNIFKEPDGFFLNAGFNFSGINTAKLFPEAFLGKDPSEAKISGSLHAIIPVTDRLKPILENSTIIIEFTRIGSRALERLLYAIDPYENNEAIISQRRLLKAGSPKKIRIAIKDGFLSIDGKISIKSITIDFPKIRRLNIARIPGIAKLENKLAVLKPVILILEKLSAETLIISKKTGALGFK